MGEMKLLKKCLGDSDGFVENNIEVYDWDYGATMFYTEQYDTWVMSGTPHAIKLVKRVYIDINTDSSYNMTETAVTAYFEQFSSTLYMSYDASCETGRSDIEPCLQKGDLIFITDANWGTSEQLMTKAGSTRFSAARAAAAGRRATPT